VRSVPGARTPLPIRKGHAKERMALSWDVCRPISRQPNLRSVDKEKLKKEYIMVVGSSSSRKTAQSENPREPRKRSDPEARGAVFIHVVFFFRDVSWIAAQALLLFTGGDLGVGGLGGGGGGGWRGWCGGAVGVARGGVGGPGGLGGGGAAGDGGGGGVRGGGGGWVRGGGGGGCGGGGCKARPGRDFEPGWFWVYIGYWLV